MKEMLHKLFAVLVCASLATGLIPATALATSSDAGASTVNTNTTPGVSPGNTSATTTTNSSNLSYGGGVTSNAPTPPDEDSTNYDWWMEREGVGLTYDKSTGYLPTEEGVPGDPGVPVSGGHAGVGTSVRGYVVNPDFSFIEATASTNFKNAFDAYDTTQTEPLVAVLQGGTGHNWINWTVEEGWVDKNGTFVPSTDPAATKDLGTTEYQATNSNLDIDYDNSGSGDPNDPDYNENYGRAITTYKHAIGPSELADNKFYRYTVSAYDYDPATDPAPADGLSDTIQILISTFDCYSYMTIDTDNANRPSAELPNVTGYVYWDPTSGQVSFLAADTIKDTSPIYNAIQQTAATETPSEPQNIATPTQINITNIENRRVTADGEKYPAYIYGLEIQLPIDKSNSALAALNEDDEVKVYRYVPETGEVEVLKGVVAIAMDEDDTKGVRRPITDDSGNFVLCVKVGIKGTLPSLGVFAIGYDSDSGNTYKINAEAKTTGNDVGGQVSPFGESTYTMETSPKYVILPNDGCEIDSITIAVKSGSSTINHSPASGALVGNVLTIDPAQYGIGAGGSADVTIYFKKAEPTEEEYNLTVSLIQGDSGAGGSLDFVTGEALTMNTKDDPGTGTAGATPPAVETVNMGGSKTAKVPSTYGVYLTFNPDAGSKVATLTVDGVEYAVLGDSFYLSTLAAAAGANVSIEVTYVSGLHEYVTTQTVEAAIVDEPTDSSGNPIDTAFVEAADGTKVKSATYSVPTGNSIQVNVWPENEYMLNYARVFLNGASGNNYIDVTDRVSKGNTKDYLYLFNVVSQYRVEFSYKHIDATLVFNVQNNSGGEINPVGTVELSAGERIRVTCTPWGSTFAGGDGKDYEIGSLVFDDGTTIHDIMEYLTERGGGTYATFTVIVGEASDVKATDGEWMVNGSKETDKVLAVNAKNGTITVSYDPKHPAAEPFLTLETEVAGIGGGTVTPTQLIQKGTAATVWFFPDQGYTIKRVTVDDIDVTNGGYNEGDVQNAVDVATGRLDFANIHKDHKVRVWFTNGQSDLPSKTKWTIYPSSSSGGFISPDDETLVYDGQSQRFNFFAMTGYVLDKVLVDDEEAETSSVDIVYDAENSYLIFRNVTDDHKIHASFIRDDSINDADTTYTVIVRPGANGTASPDGVVAVGAGTTLPITILPNAGYTYDSVEMKSLTTGVSHDMVHTKEVVKSIATLYNVHDNYEVNITFRPLEPGETQDPENDPHNLIVWTNDNLDLSDGEGATLSPEVDGLTFYMHPGTNYSETPGNFTLIIDSAHELESLSIDTHQPMYGTIPINNVTKRGEGVYTFQIDRVHIWQTSVIKVETQIKLDSTENVNLRTITVQSEGEGTIYPNGIEGVFYIENGKSQTFYFEPKSGYRLDMVYINNMPVTVKDLSYTIPAVTTNTNVRAVFISGTQEPSVADLGGFVNVDVQIKTGSNGKPNGSAYPTKTKVLKGGSASFTVVPDEGYVVHVYKGSQSAANEITNTMSGNTVQLKNITANTNLVVWFEHGLDNKQQYYNVTVSHGDYGWASPKGVTKVLEGQNLTITILPDAGCSLQSLTVNGVDKTGDVSGLQYTTQTLDENSGNLNIYVTFMRGGSGPDITSLTLFDVEAYGLSGGIASPTSMKVKSGSKSQVTFIPVQNYTMNYVAVNGGDENAADGGFNVEPGSTVQGVTVSTDGIVTINNVTKNYTLVGHFDKDDNSDFVSTHYTILVNTDGNGSVSPARAVSVPSNGAQTFTFLPNAGYKVDYLRITHVIDGVDGVPRDIKPFTGASYTLFNVTNDIKLNVYFTKLADGEAATPVHTYDIKATASMNGAISPSGTTKVAVGANAYFNFVPLYGYKLSYAVVDGVNVPASLINRNQYVFANVQDDHTIHAVFCKTSENVQDFVTIIAGNPAGGMITPNGSVLVHKGADASFTISNYYGYRLVSVDVDGGAANAAHGGYSIGPASSSNSEYSWDGSTFTFKNISQDGHRLGATFELVGDDPIAKASEYTSITVSGCEAGAGGQLSFPEGTSIIEALADNETLDISFIPDEGKSIHKIVITFPDGTTRTLEGSDADRVWQDGFITFQPHQVNSVNGNGLSIAMTWQNIQAEQSGMTPAKYNEILSTSEGDGRINPRGLLKVAQGASMRFSLIPDSGNELSSLLVDDQEKVGVKSGANDLTATAEARTWTFSNINDDHTIHATFALEDDETIPYHTITTRAVGVGDDPHGKVSPSEVQVQHGGTVTINFFPDQYYKLTSIEIDGSRVNYNFPTYTLRSVTADTEIVAYFNEMVPGDEAWDLTPIDVVATVKKLSDGQTHGKVSPSSAPTADPNVYETAVTVPLGRTQTFSLMPDDGYEVDYVIFNGDIRFVSSGVTTYTVSPVQLPGNAQNTFQVVYKEAESRGDVTVNVSVSSAESSSLPAIARGSGKVMPSYRVVPYGGSAQFYIIPDEGSTIESVTVSGHPVDWIGVTDTSNLRTISGQGTETVETALYRGGATISQAAQGDPYYSVYSTTIPSVTHDESLNVTFRKITETDPEVIRVKTHMLTVTTEGGGIASPIGQMQIPEGSIESIRTKAYSGYYLDAVTLKYKNEDGEEVTQDITNQMEGSFLKYMMGKTDASIHFKFTLIGTPSYVNLEIGDSYLPVLDEDGNQAFDEDNNPLRTDVKPVLNPSLTNLDGTPIDFVRDKPQTFIVQTDQLGPNGRMLVPETIYYNGTKVGFDSKQGTMTLILDASGTIDIVWRELNEDEEPPSYPGYHVEAKIVEGEGTIVGAPVQTIPQISLDRVATWGFKPAEGYILSSVVDYYCEDGALEPTPHNITNQIDGKDGSLTLIDIDRDHVIEVSFAEVLRLTTEWNNEHGFITPNTAPGEFLYVELGTSLRFIVAPYFGYEVSGVWVDADERTGDLQQNEQTRSDITEKTNNRVIYFEEDQGVQGAGRGVSAQSGEMISASSVNASDYQSVDVLSDATEVVTPDKGIFSGLIALATGETTMVPIVGSSNGNDIEDSVEAQKKPFARAYSFVTGELAPKNTSASNNSNINTNDEGDEGSGDGGSGDETLEPTATGSHDIHVRAEFIQDDTQDLRDAQFKIDASVILDSKGNGHGTIDGVIEKTIYADEGSSVTLNFIPDDGYAVAVLKVNGTPIKFTGTSYTITDIKSDYTIEVGFDDPKNPGKNDTVGRILRTLQALAQTGDLNGPAIVMLLLVAAGALLFVFLSGGKRRRAEDDDY